LTEKSQKVNCIKPLKDILLIKRNLNSFLPRSIGILLVTFNQTNVKRLPVSIRLNFAYIRPCYLNFTVLGIPNLFIVETIDSAKKADTLNKACIAVGRQNKLKVYVQVNTSGEEGKLQIQTNISN
jgi:hypothetical protein